MIDHGPKHGHIWMTYNERMIRIWKLVTDERGQYQIDASTVKAQPSSVYFDGWARGNGYAEYKMRYAWSVQEVKEKAGRS